MKIRDRLNVRYRGKPYGLVAASDGRMQTIKSPEKGWQSFFPKPDEHYSIPDNFKPLYGKRLYTACNLFLMCYWPDFRQVYPNGLTNNIKSIR